MKIAILEASHWHVPLYLGALAEEPGVEVVAVSDREDGRGAAVARRFSARFYRTSEELLENERLDFVFAFGRHRDMTQIGQLLLDRGLPFALEKPCGMNAAEVGALRRRADEEHIFVSVPLIQGFSGLYKEAESIVAATGAKWSHMSFRFIAGPAQRYRDNYCPWMLDGSLAGGGCTINLAVHFIDLILRLTGANIRDVTARMMVDRTVADVEIFSHLALRTDQDQICAVETGYTYPGGTDEQRDFSFSLASDHFYIRSEPGGIRYVPRDGSSSRTLDMGFETDLYYSTFVTDTIGRLTRGKQPFSGLADMERVMSVIDCAYASSAKGGETLLISPGDRDPATATARKLEGISKQGTR